MSEIFISVVRNTAQLVGCTLELSQMFFASSYISTLKPWNNVLQCIRESKFWNESWMAILHETLHMKLHVAVFIRFSFSKPITVAREIKLEIYG